ncbi:surfactant protein B containing protein [Thecamonas trahens ATCC 50062]|uniref:Surfactant protein B containing protein n=1 Tax=Thecamonas trahens ATCC 50062 TaxID=461836 RepID=A0A0L0D545_THETB|nr:surfactant protein B containing protein [Thecamonas trahens ATCC 50062]KNC46423.1 surfactant protein B containing protein [Thecamonas trahens ATCC 50062]|eukprot:XP_013760714.1 surfactant protein B containing protein [Thecamonas trahens ATCC 50062]
MRGAFSTAGAVLVVLCVTVVCVANGFTLRSLAVGAVGEGGDANGGSDCAACTIIVGLLEQKAVVDAKSIENVLDEVCGFFPAGAVQAACKFLVDTYTPDLLRLLEEKATPDEVCKEFRMCTGFPECHLYPLPTDKARVTNEVRSELSPRVAAAYAAGETPIDWLKHLINVVGNLHEPLVDFDDDKFGTESTLRGTSWRGADCHDVEADVYPGRAASSHPPTVDHNCNGILGVNPETGGAWEDELCGGEHAGLGLIVAGDSVTANFGLPPQYFNAAHLNGTTFKAKPDVMWRLENEFDHPYRSWGTGFANVTYHGYPDTVSVYSHMLERNLCMHRDFQNTGVNGARSGAEAGGSHPLIKDIARNQKTDKPVLFILDQAGNDVCNSRTAVDHMTSAAQFKANYLEMLEFLDATLPAGSHVVLMGLAQGTVLYDTMHNRTHPIGVPYTSVYSFLNCLQISPCAGWLNTNASIRAATQAHADLLSSTLEALVANVSGNYANFDMTYISFSTLINDLFDTLPPSEHYTLINPVDSFHPAQIAAPVLGRIVWDHIPDEFKPAVNPNNAKIAALFGDQGGYKFTVGGD